MPVVFCSVWIWMQGLLTFSELCHEFHGGLLFNAVIYCIQRSLLAVCCQACSLANPVMKWDHAFETEAVKRMSPHNCAQIKKEHQYHALLTSAENHV